MSLTAYGVGIAVVVIMILHPFVSVFIHQKTPSPTTSPPPTAHTPPAIAALIDDAPRSDTGDVVSEQSSLSSVISGCSHRFKSDAIDSTDSTHWREPYVLMKANLTRIDAWLRASVKNASDDMRPHVRPRPGFREYCHEGTFKITRSIAHTSSVNVYEARVTDTGKSVVVKYANDCKSRLEEGGPRDTLHTDFAYLSALVDSGTVVVPLHISPPARLPSGLVASRIMTAYLDAHYDSCVRVGTQVRFSVLAKAGIALDQYLNALLKMGGRWVEIARRTVALSTRVIEMLKEIHDRGIIHGDIHAGNILFKEPYSAAHEVSTIDTDLVFIDFEYATFFPNDFGSPIHQPRTPTLNRHLLSPWQLAGERMGRRDDVYRALAFMANGLSVGDAERKYDNRVEDKRALSGDVTDDYLVRLKNVRKMFNLSLARMRSGPEWMQANVVLASLIRDELESLVHPDMRPNYDAIVAKLKTLHALLV